MNFLSILSDHQLRYPAMGAQDVYKLIYQAACGPGHAVSNPAQARDWLEKELHNLSDPHPEPAIDPISPDGKLVRVHLSPYLAGGGDRETLLQAFIQTSCEFCPDQLKLERTLKAALPYVEGLKELMKTLKTGGYPAVHHSEQYRAAYKPAYRVVLKKLL